MTERAGQTTNKLPAAPALAGKVLTSAWLALQRRQVWLVATTAVLMLWAAMAWVFWHERGQLLDQAAEHAQRQVLRLDESLARSLAMALVVINAQEARLQQLPMGVSAADGWRVALQSHEAMLAWLALPFRLVMLDAQGQAMGAAAATPPPVPATSAAWSGPALAGSAGWQVGLTGRVAGKLVLPLRQAAAANAHGVATYELQFTHEALLRQFDGERHFAGGGVALFRAETDGSISILARVPHDEAALGRRVRGPLAQLVPTSNSGVFNDLTRIDNRQRLVAYRRMGGGAEQMVVAYGIATDALLAQWHERAWLAFAASMLLAAGVFWGARRLIHALTVMTRDRQALGDSEERYRELFENNPMPMLVHDLQGGLGLLAVNAAFVTQYGYGREQALGMSLLDLYPEEERAAVVDRFSKMVGPVRASERHHRLKSGELVTVELRSHALDFSGQAARIVVINNITERKRADAALRHSEQRFRLASAYGHVWEWDFGANDTVPPAEFFGLLNLDLAIGATGSAFEDAVHPDDLVRLKQVLVRHLKRQGNYQVQFRAFDAKGRVHWFETQGQALWNEQGRATYIAGTTFEITQRREAEDQVRRLAVDLEQRVIERTAQLARSEARYRNIVETVPVAIMEEDWSDVQRLLRGLREQGVQDGPAHFAAHPDFVQSCLDAVRVTSRNHQAQAMHGAHPDTDSENGLAWVFAKPEQLALFADELAAMWTGPGQFTAKRQLPIPSATESTFSLILTMSVPGLDDSDATVLACLADITEIDRLNSELDATVARLRQVNQELQTFTYTVSHDLKAPLRGIDGYSRLLLSDHHDQLDDEGRGFIENIRRATRQMGALIDDLLAYSRLERRELKLTPVPLAPLVDSVLSACRQNLPPEGIEWVVQVDPALMVLADVQSLSMALRNLLDNAVKFSHNSPAPRIEVSAEHWGEARLRLQVGDNGIGFDMKFHDRVFAIFQRLHRAEDYPGTGIGLAIVQKAVKRMGGQVWAQSRPGEGAMFTVELPESSAP